jgi:hypothetical protein
VCYAVDELSGPTMSIRAFLTRTDPNVSEVEIRAVAIGVPDGEVPWWTPWFSPLMAGSVAVPWVMSWYTAASWLWTQELFATPASDNILRDSSPTTVRFGAADQTAADLAVPVERLRSAGVGVYEQRWHWQWRSADRTEWQWFASTRHTVYGVIGRPTLPWMQLPFVAENTQLPWTDVLDVACRWAAGSRTRAEVADRITRAVNDLGRRGIHEYNCVGPGVNNLGSPHYTLIPGFFECTALLARIRGGLGNGPYVNCSDCAALVSTFANALGCDLWQSRILGSTPFPVNPTLAIGFRTWLSACAIGALSMHEVAWADNCGEDDEVFDACLHVDDDPDPTRAPHLARLPVGMRFGRAGDGQYGDRLVAPAGRLTCRPHPPSRQRRVVV